MSKYIKKDENGFYVFDEQEFLKVIPTGLEYFAVDEETEKIYNLGFNYKEKMEKQISYLQSQLAEKDEEFNWLHNKFAKFVEQHNQDKISFCIEQLKKVKDIINASVRDDHIIWDFDIKEHIDNQIKQLTHKHEDKGE